MKNAVALNAIGNSKDRELDQSVKEWSGKCEFTQMENGGKHCAEQEAVSKYWSQELYSRGIHLAA